MAETKGQIGNEKRYDGWQTSNCQNFIVGCRKKLTKQSLKDTIKQID
jgi:hypothetical protein